MPIDPMNFMAVLQVAILVRAQHVEVAIVNKQFVTGGNIDFVAIESNAAKATIGASPFPVDFVGIPVNALRSLLLLEIDGKYTAMAFALLTAADNGSYDEFWQLDGHQSLSFNP